MYWTPSIRVDDDSGATWLHDGTEWHLVIEPGGNMAPGTHYMLAEHCAPARRQWALRQPITDGESCEF